MRDEGRCRAGALAASSASGRVSLANLDEYDYPNIGRSLRKLASEYFAIFEKGNGKGPAKTAAKTGKAGKKQ